eukprot:7382813-Prymnesium_polylepis.1
MFGRGFVHGCPQRAQRGGIRRHERPIVHRRTAPSTEAWVCVLKTEGGSISNVKTARDRGPPVKSLSNRSRQMQPLAAPPRTPTPGPVKLPRTPRWSR